MQRHLVCYPSTLLSVCPSFSYAMASRHIVHSASPHMGPTCALLTKGGSTTQTGELAHCHDLRKATWSKKPDSMEYDSGTRE